MRFARNRKEAASSAVSVSTDRQTVRFRVSPFGRFVFLCPRVLVFFVVIRYCNHRRPPASSPSRGLSLSLPSASSNAARSRPRTAPDPKQNIWERRCDHQTIRHQTPADTGKQYGVLGPSPLSEWPLGQLWARIRRESERQRTTAKPSDRRERVRGEEKKDETDKKSLLPIFSGRRRARLGAQEALIHTCHWLHGSRKSEKNSQEKEKKRKRGACWGRL